MTNDIKQVADSDRHKAKTFLINASLIATLLLIGPFLVILASFFGGNAFDGFMGSYGNTGLGNVLLSVSAVLSVGGGVAAVAYASVCSVRYSKSDKRYLIILGLTVVLPVILVVAALLLNQSIIYCSEYPGDCLS